MKVVHVVPGINIEASGPAYSVPALCEGLARKGVEVELHVLEPAPEMKDRGFKLHTYPWWRPMPKLGISKAMKRALAEKALTADIIHNHSLWMMPNVYPAAAVKNKKCMLVTSPRGTLSPISLESSRLLKRLMWKACQEKTVTGSACLHATTEREYRDIRAAGIKAPVAVIPNGVHVPEINQSVQAHGKNKRTLLFLGRIHPIKGIDMLLRSWKKVEAEFPEWELKIAGPDNLGYLNEMKRLSGSLAAKRVFFTGPVYGSEKQKAFESADVFVLPTRTENFGMAVAEALAHGLPVIVSKGAPWPEIENRKCGFWIEMGEKPLEDCLRSVLKMTKEELQTYGARGRQWMKEDFSWDRIAEMMRDTYEWMINKGDTPTWVKTA